MNKLKGLRVIVALFFFLLTTLFFVDFGQLLPTMVHGLFHLQLVPAILAGAVLLVVFLLLITFLFGRIYCSFICPAGIFQDIFIRFSGRGRLKNKHKRWFSYHKPFNVLRYALLGVIVVLLVFGSIHLLLYLDPYSNYGRIASNIFRPIVILGNNLLAKGLMAVENYSLYYTSIYNVTVSSLIASVAVFLLFGILPVVRGRLFCNTLCPVGGLLSLFSRYSLFRISFDKEACNHCGLCERTCKSECINSKEQTADISRCVSCFNCLSSCKKGNAIHYRLAPVFKRKAVKEAKAEILAEDKSVSESRRSFLALSGTILATVPFLQGCVGKQDDKSDAMPVLPPGAKNIKHFSEKCTACHLCVSKCPVQIIQPAGFQYGLGFFLKPRLVFRKGYCNPECTVCSEVCPNKALEALNKEEKAQTQLGIAHFTRERCVVYRDETDCGACSEHCSTQAVKMVPYKDSLRIPEVTSEICIGCGGCEYICPVRPERAINIIASEEQKQARKPDYEKVKEVEDVGFGF